MTARFLIAGILCLVSIDGATQQAAPVAMSQAEIKQSLAAALTGSWTGVLEYRDYQSDGRVKLPTWLMVSPDGAVLRFNYIYDDGPTKTVTEASRVTIDADKSTWTIISSDPKDAPDVAVIDGLTRLKNGRGVLVLTGKGTDNNKPADVRTTIRVGRNILEITRETKQVGEEFKFRHAYTFTRSAPPAGPVVTR